MGVANTLLCLIPGGKAVSAYKAATAGGSFVLKTFAVQFGKAVGLGIASGYATDAGIEVTRQLATGTKLTNLEYDRINEAGVTGAIAGGAGAIFGASVEALANTRIGQSVAEKATEVFGKGKTAVKNGFAKVAKKNGKTVKADTEFKQTFYQVTSKKDAKTILRDNVLIGKEFKEVYAWTVQTTLKQVSDSGARSMETVISFEVHPNVFTRDPHIDESLKDIARISVRPAPITVSNVKEVGFKKEWWKFWTK